MKCFLQTLALVGSIGLVGWMNTVHGATPMPSQPYSVCIGRLVIDLPAGTSTSIDASYHFIEPQKPKQVDSFEQVKQQLDARAKELEAHKIHRTPDDDLMARAAGYDPEKIYGKTQLIGFNVDDSLQQISLGYQPKSDEFGSITEVYKIVGQQAYVFKSKIISADKYPATHQALWSAATSFTPLNNRTLPTKPGFCVDGGMFADSGKPPVKESFTLVVRFADHPDAQLVIDAHAIDAVNKDEPSLRHRVDGELNILRANVQGKVGVIDRGDLAAAGQDGYQIGISAPYDLVPGTVRKFFWSADGVPNDVTRPFMEVDLTIQSTDVGKSTIKDDAEAKALWEQLLHSLRIRPGAV